MRRPNGRVYSPLSVHLTTGSDAIEIVDQEADGPPKRWLVDAESARGLASSLQNAAHLLTEATKPPDPDIGEQK